MQNVDNSLWGVSMTGTTHVPAGVATSLVILRPTTVTGIIAAVAGGAIGGWICDIDVRDNAVDRDMVESLLLMAVITTICVAIDFLHGGGLCDYWMSHWGISAVVELALFAAFLIVGVASSHRTFTHSFIAMGASTTLVWFLLRPLAPAYLIGYASHIALDLFNKKGEQLLWPLSPKVSFNLCDADGVANRIIGGISVAVAFALSAILLVVAFSKGNVAGVAIAQNASVVGRLNNLQLYLIGINILTFFVFLIDYELCMRGIIDYDRQDTVHNFTNLFPLAGGAIGALAVFALVRQPLTKDTATWWDRIISMLVAWVTIYCIVLDPFNLGFGSINKDWRAHIILAAYIIVINVITITIFVRDFHKRHREFDSVNILMLITGALGGALGGYLTICLSGRKMQSDFYYFFPEMIAAHVLVIGYLLLAGIA